MSAAKKMEFITLDDAIAIADKFFNFDTTNDKHVYQKSYLYNLISAGKLSRHGPYHLTQLEKNEFVSWLESKKIKQERAWLKNKKKS